MRKHERLKFQLAACPAVSDRYCYRGKHLGRRFIPCEGIPRRNRGAVYGDSKTWPPSNLSRNVPMKHHRKVALNLASHHGITPTYSISVRVLVSQYPVEFLPEYD